MNIIEKYQDVSFRNGKFLSDKSYAYDSIYFIAKFFYEYSDNGIVDLKKYPIYLAEYISKVFSISNEDDIRNYMNEACHVFVYSKIVERIEKNVFKIIDNEALEFIVSKIENAYIYIYSLCYYTMKNSNALGLYQDFCNSNFIPQKMKILEEINEILYKLNPSTKSGAESQWAKQNTKYIINNLNFINNQPEITRTLTINKDVKRNPETISTNVEGTRTTGTKNNSYLYKFDYEYVQNKLKDILVKGVI